MHGLLNCLCTYFVCVFLFLSFFSVTRLDNFWNVIATNLTYTSGPNMWCYFGLYWKESLLNKNCRTYFWGIFGKSRILFNQHLVTLLCLFCDVMEKNSFVKRERQIWTFLWRNDNTKKPFARLNLFVSSR